jgi:hypothetical protein
MEIYPLVTHPVLSTDFGNWTSFDRAFDRDAPIISASEIDDPCVPGEQHQRGGQLRCGESTTNFVVIFDALEIHARAIVG